MIIKITVAGGEPLTMPAPERQEDDEAAVRAFLDEQRGANDVS